MLCGAAGEAERILHDAVGKLDDPLHLRCTSSPGMCLLAATVPSLAVGGVGLGPQPPGYMPCCGRCGPEASAPLRLQTTW